MFFLQKNLVFSTPGDPLNRQKKRHFFSSTLALSPRSSSFYPLLLTFPYLEVIQDLKNATFGVNNTAEAQKLAKLQQFPFFLLLLLSISCQIKLLQGDTIQVFIHKSIDSSSSCYLLLHWYTYSYFSLTQLTLTNLTQPNSCSLFLYFFWLVCLLGWTQLNSSWIWISCFLPSSLQ